MRSRTPVTAEARFQPRRGVVLIGVLIVVTLLSLAAYQFADLMTAQHREAYTFTRAAQVRAFAESGIHYAAAALSNPTNITNVLGGSPLNNSSAFQDQQVADDSDGSPRGLFSIVSGGDPDNQVTDGSGLLYGVIDENGKINVNTVMKTDPSGNTLYNLLMQLPNMTDDVANAIVDWIDPDDNPRSNGAESDYYTSLQPPYRCKNGPLDSLEELLLVRGVTPQLLFGNDKNHNGMIDGDEDNSDGSGCGWSSYLTTYSRESNVDSTGNQRVWINDSNLSNLQTNLGNATVTSDLVNFILLYRIYGGTTSLPKTSQAQPASSWSPGDLSTQKGSNQIKSLFDLTNSYVMVPGKTAKDPATYYASPLLDQSQWESVLPTLFDKVSTSQSQYVWGRINVNTAPQAVINALAGLGQKQSQSQSGGSSGTGSSASSSQNSNNSSQSQSQGYLSSDDINQIIANRPQMYSGSAPDPVYNSLAWLLTRAQLSVAKLKQIEQYVTTTSQVFRVQSVGYFEGGNQYARVEAVIDTNGGQPRLVTPIRDLSPLGKGFNLQK